MKPEIRKHQFGWYVWFPSGLRYYAVRTWEEGLNAVSLHFKTGGSFPQENRFGLA